MFHRPAVSTDNLYDSNYMLFVLIVVLASSEQ